MTSDPTPKAVVVPVEPTEAMMSAGMERLIHGGAHLGLKNAFKAMALATPQASLPPVEGVREAVEFMQKAAVMLGRGEMPAPGSQYAADWYRAHATILAALSPVPSSVGSAVPADGNTIGVSGGPTPVPSGGGEPVNVPKPDPWSDYPRESYDRRYEIGMREDAEGGSSCPMCTGELDQSDAVVIVAHNGSLALCHVACLPDECHLDRRTAPAPVPAVEAAQVARDRLEDLALCLDTLANSTRYDGPGREALATARVDILDIRRGLSAPSAPGEPLPDDGEKLRAALRRISEDAPTAIRAGKTYKAGFDNAHYWAGDIARSALEGSR